MGSRAAVLLAVPAQAQVMDPPWCARDGGENQYENCGYFSWQQCMASVSGVGGWCFRNPRAAHNRIDPPRRVKRERR